MTRNNATQHPLASFAPDIAKCLHAVTRLRKRLAMAGHDEAAALLHGDGLALVQALATAQVVSPRPRIEATTL